MTHHTIATISMYRNVGWFHLRIDKHSCTVKLAALYRRRPITARRPTAARRRSGPQKSPPARTADQICELCSARVAYSVLVIYYKYLNNQIWGKSCTSRPASAETRLELRYVRNTRCINIQVRAYVTVTNGSTLPWNSLEIQLDLYLD